MNLVEHYTRIKLYSTFIYSMYRKLARLELEGKTNSEEYKKSIETINRVKKAEKDYYTYLSTLGDEKFILSFNVMAQKDALGQTTISRPLHDPAYLFSRKVSENQIIVMRISSKITDVFRHMFYKDPATLNVYDTYAPLRDKQFLDVLSSQIEDADYRDVKKILIRSKYDYAFVNDKDVLSLREYDEEKEDNENLDLIISLGTVLEYKDKFAKLDNKTLMHPNNVKRLLLDVDYIRASALSVPNEQLETLKMVILSQKEELSEGTCVFLNILDMAMEDKNDFEEIDIPYKRKF